MQFGPASSKSIISNGEIGQLVSFPVDLDGRNRTARFVPQPQGEVVGLVRLLNNLDSRRDRSDTEILHSQVSMPGSVSILYRPAPGDQVGVRHQSASLPGRVAVRRTALQLNFHGHVD